MNIRKILRNFVIIMIVGCNIGCDQISKNIVRDKMDYNETIELMDNHITLTKVENTGAFLSLGNGLPRYVKFILLSLLPMLVLLFSIYLVIAKTSMPRLLITGLCFVIGGGLGNLYDRILYGSVTDFLHIDFILFHTGIFNMADVSIMLGMFIIMAELYFKKNRAELVSPAPGNEELNIF